MTIDQVLRRSARGEHVEDAGTPAKRLFLEHPSPHQSEVRADAIGGRQEVGLGTSVEQAVRQSVVPSELVPRELYSFSDRVGHRLEVAGFEGVNCHQMLVPNGRGVSTSCD